MENFFSHKEAYVVLGLLALAVPAATAIVAYCWYKFRREEMRTNLKLAMLERGLSAEEVRIVIEAGATGVAAREVLTR
jgi:hypothetical protein